MYALKDYSPPPSPSQSPPQLLVLPEVEILRRPHLLLPANSTTIVSLSERKVIHLQTYARGAVISSMCIAYLGMPAVLFKGHLFGVAITIIGLCCFNLSCTWMFITDRMLEIHKDKTSFLNAEGSWNLLAVDDALMEAYKLGYPSDGMKHYLNQHLIKLYFTDQ